MWYINLFGRLSPVWFFLCLQLISMSAMASSLNLEVISGDDSSHNSNLDVSLDIPAGGSVYGSYGQSKLSGTVDLDTTEYSLGVETDSLAEVGVGIEGSYWGQSGSLEIISKQLNLNINPIDWALSISPRIRNIFIYTTQLFVRLPESIDVESRGIEFSADYYGFMPWTVGASWLSNEYDKDISRLADNSSVLLLLALSPSTLHLASGFESHSGTLRIGYDFNWGNIEVEGSRSESAVDGSIANYRGVTLYWPKNKDWQLYLGYGKQTLESSSSDDVALTRAGLTWNW